MPRVAIVAALEREIRPLIRHWRSSEREHSGRRFRFFETQDCVAVCGGIGAEPARRATEAALALFGPEVVYSAGFAGALDPSLCVAQVVIPRRVVDASDGSSLDTGRGEGVLVSFRSIAGPEQKQKLADSFGASAVDMEAAFVARAAQARGISFAAFKSISDESDLGLPETDAFITAEGQFRTAKFTLFALARPWLWGGLIRLARNSRRASEALCKCLQQNLNAANMAHT